MVSPVPRLGMFAGANGSGKSTLKDYLAPEWLGVYVNADEIEKGLRSGAGLNFADFEISVTNAELQSFLAASSLVAKQSLRDEALRLQVVDGVLSFDAIEPNSYYASVLADLIRQKLLRAAALAAGLEVLRSEAGAACLLQPLGYHYTPDPHWPVADAHGRLHAFIEQRLARYPLARDQLAEGGTSQLSPYLRFGLLSIRECLRAALSAGQGEKWIAELGWREFYAAILYHFPEVETEEFHPHYRHGALPWRKEEALVYAFTQGRTGYPIVDAAVRELLTTGFMHNRARMIVASFATKDLLLDWRIGEAFFAQHLMDYELASNNGGWQWPASTGTDASPYFRVFNPWLQSRKFDPEGVYIRRHVPELRALPTAEIHAPSQLLLKSMDYPAPVVDHAAAKARVVALFKQAGQKAR